MVDATHLKRMISDELPALIALRRDLHAHPEIAYQEVRTSAVVVRELTAAGVEYRSGLAGGTGVIGWLQGEAAGATALRADMDALPLTEESDCAWKSTTPGRMHACGHDGHTTILLGAAHVLARLANARMLPHPVRFVFQPAEENGGGAARMIQDGALDPHPGAPAPARIVGLHGWPWLPEGELALRSGPVMASADEVRITVRGVGSHAAMPHTGRDPVLAASAIVVALQQIVARTVDPLDAAVVGISAVHGGTAGNVIPDSVELLGTMRALSGTTRNDLRERIERVAHHVALAHDCSAAVAFRDGYPVTVNDASLADHTRTVLERAHGGDRVRHFPAPVMGAEDFSYYGQRVPACFFVLGLAVPGKPVHPLHSPQFDFNDQAIAAGVLSMCALALSAPA